MQTAKVIKRMKDLSKERLNFFQIYPLVKTTKVIEIRLCLNIVEHNHSAVSVEHLVKFFKSSYELLNPSSNVLKNFTCGRTKCTAIIQNVIGKEGEGRILKKIRENDFSLLIDESTDITSAKHLALIVRTLNTHGVSSFEVNDEFLTLLPVIDESAQGLHASIVNYFNANSVPYKARMKGFASDNASVMVGVNNSVASRFKEEIPDLFTVGCTCHSLALCALAAGKQIPGVIEDLLHRVCMYFKNSGKRMRLFEEMQAELNINILKILLRKVETRWLSLSACVQRIVHLLPALRVYFGKELETFNNIFKLSLEKAALKRDLQYIVELLNNPLTELLLNFLSYVLPLVCNLNLEFQSETPHILDLYDKMLQIRSRLMKNYIRSEYVNDKTLRLRNGHNNPNYFLKDEDVHAGPLVTIYLQNNKVSENKKKEFIATVRNFYVTLLDELFNRFSFPNQDKLLEYISVLKPSNLKITRTLAALLGLVPKSLHIDPLVLDRELEMLQEERNLDFNADILTFYKCVENIKLGNGSPAYPSVLKLAKFALLLPHSTASVERLFSAVNLNKTKTRNALQRKTLCGILHGKNLLKLAKSNCFNYCVPDTMLKLHNSGMYNDADKTDNGLFGDGEDCEDHTRT